MEREHPREPAMTVIRLLLLAAGLCALDARAAEYLELDHFHLIDGTGAAEREVGRLVARDGVIVAIDDQGAAPRPEPGSTWTRIDLDGAWVMPGLIDTHVHVARFDDTLAQAEKILREAVRGGVTGVRDMGGDARSLAEIDRAMAAGEFVGPHLLYSALFGGPGIFEGPPISQMAVGHEPGHAPWARALTEGDDVRAAVAEARGTGAGNVKVYGNLAPELARQLIVESRRQGLLSAAHATVFPTAPGQLVDAGIGSLAHAPYLVWAAVDKVPDDYGARIAGPWKTVPPDHPKLRALYKAMAAHGVLLDATLYVYKAMNNYAPGLHMDWADDAFAWGAQATRLAHEAGVRVTTGTDWFEPREGELPHTHEEMALLVEAAGFSPMDAIVAATRNGAAALGLEETTGTVQVGKQADLLVVNADPLADIRNSTRIRMTVRAGTVLKPIYPDQE
jgi:imidazolonepropionase-like amidohydrolase